MWYTIRVHKTVYASGFLYRPKSQQILLQQIIQEKSQTSSVWAMVGGENHKEEAADAAFQRIIDTLFKVKLVTKFIYPIYDYFSYDDKKFHYVFYGEVGETKKIAFPKRGTFSWFTFKQIAKLPFTQQTRQDIIVAQRVINAKSRNLESILVHKS